MRHRIAAVRQALAPAGTEAQEIEARVVASVTQLGLVARLVSPALAALILGYRLSAQPADWWWQDVLGGPYPLSIPLPVHGLDGRAQSADTACRKLVAELIEPVTVAVAEQVPVSTRVLWGNVASAVNSASLQVATKQPAAAQDALHFAEIVFSAPQLWSERDHPGPVFRRSSCCLIYRLSAEKSRGTCRDCVLR